MVRMKKSAWDYDASDTEAVKYWKLQVRHWQNIAVLGFLGGLVFGVMASAITMSLMGGA